MELEKLKENIALGTLNQSPIDWTNNLENIKGAIKNAKEAGCTMLVLPELSLCGYSCEDLFFSNWLSDKCTNLLKEIVPITKGIWTNIGMPIRFEDSLYNCQVVLSDQKIIGVAAKQLLANDGVYYEKRWFSPWKKGKITSISILGTKVPIGEQTFEFEGQRIAFEICEDAWHEDSRPGNSYSKSGIDILINPSASHFTFGKAFFRRDLIKSSSEKFNCLYLYSNLLGNDAGRLIFDGEMLAAEKGQLLASNRFFSFRAFNLLFLNGEDQQEEQDLSDFEFFPRAIALSLFDYMRRSRTKGFVLSLSGGADSACCAVLISEMVKNAVRDLGLQGFLVRAGLDEKVKSKSVEGIINEILITAYQGTTNSSEDTRNAAKSLARALNSRHLEWEVDQQISSYKQIVEQSVGSKLSWENDDLALQNIQARARVPGIWLLANFYGFLLISTSNRSELDVGYTTMDGDAAGSLAPIGGVSKHFVLEWLKFAKDRLGYSGLEDVIKLEPTAELRPAEQQQKDEDDLMPYKALNMIERLALVERLDPSGVLQQMRRSEFGNNPELEAWVSKFFLLWSRNQWKRERIAPAFHVDDHSVDPKTWCRFPILSGSFREELKDLKKQ